MRGSQRVREVYIRQEEEREGEIERKIEGVKRYTGKQRAERKREEGKGERKINE